MIKLAGRQKKNIGFAWVMEQVHPASAYGRARLKQLQPYGPKQAAALQTELDNVERARIYRKQNEKAYARIEHIFAQMKDILGTIGRMDGEALGEVDLFELKRFLLQLREVEPLFEEVNVAASYEGIAFEKTGGALEILDIEKSGVASFHISSQYSAKLAEARRGKTEAEERMRKAQTEEQRKAAEELRREAVSKEAQEEKAVCHMLSERLRPFASALVHNAGAVAVFDLVLQKAALAERLGGIKPEIGAGRVQVQAMVNPEVAEILAEQGRKFTPLDIELEKGSTVITGANMGGKSVALKTLALNVLLVHYGFYPFAQKAALPLFETVHIVSEDLEEVERGLSSFGGEIAKLNEVLCDVDDGDCLVLLDEFARGTNPEEGAAIAQGVAEYLNGQDCMAVMTTHYEHVAARAGAHYQVVGLGNADMVKMKAEMAARPEQNRMELIAEYMDYGLVRVKPDSALPKDALNICRLLGLRKDLLQFVEKYY